MKKIVGYYLLALRASAEMLIDVLLKPEKPEVDHRSECEKEASESETETLLIWIERAIRLTRQGVFLVLLIAVSSLLFLTLLLTVESTGLHVTTLRSHVHSPGALAVIGWMFMPFYGCFIGYCVQLACSRARKTIWFA